MALEQAGAGAASRAGPSAAGRTVRVIVLDNLKEGVLTPNIYEPTLNSFYRDVRPHAARRLRNRRAGPGDSWRWGDRVPTLETRLGESLGGRDSVDQPRAGGGPTRSGRPTEVGEIEQPSRSKRM